MEIKVLLFMLGASLGLAGMVTQRDWLVWTGIVVLAPAIIMGLIQRRRADAMPDDGGDDE